MIGESPRRFSIVQSIVGLLLAFLIAAVVNEVAYFGLSILDMTRGLEDKWLNSLFRSLFAPAVGAYAGVYAAHTCLANANMRFVFWAFSLPFILGLFVFPLTFVFKGEGFPTSSFWYGVRFAACATYIAGAYFAYRKIASPVELPKL